MSNTSQEQFDAIVVLGTPADVEGNPSPELMDRITEGVREYQRGVAPRLIVSGGAAHNRFVEADVMARVAEAQGVSATVILREPRALDTIQNECYSAQILKAHGWRSMEIVSSPTHLPRAALIASNLPLAGIRWRMHPAGDVLTPGYVRDAGPIVEMLKTVRYLVWTRWSDRCEI